MHAQALCAKTRCGSARTRIQPGRAGDRFAVTPALDLAAIEGLSGDPRVRQRRAPRVCCRFALPSHPSPRAVVFVTVKDQADLTVRDEVACAGPVRMTSASQMRPGRNRLGS